MKPLILKVIINPESINKLSNSNIRNLTISNTELIIGKAHYNISDISEKTLDKDHLTLTIGSNTLCLGVQTYGLKNITDDFLTPLLNDLLNAIISNDKPVIESCISQLSHARRAHTIRAIALFTFFPVWLICASPVGKFIAGLLDHNMSTQTSLRLGFGLYFILTFPIWMWIFKKGKGFAFEIKKEAEPAR